MGKILDWLFNRDKIVSLIVGEYRKSLTPMDKAFIMACRRLQLDFNYRGFFSSEGWYPEEEYSKYNFFKFNHKVHQKYMDSGHLREFVYLLLDKMSYSKEHWVAFYKFLSLFDGKHSRLAEEISNWIYLYDEKIRINNWINPKLIFTLKHCVLYFSYFQVITEIYVKLFNTVFENARTKESNPNAINKYYSILGISYTKDKVIIKKAYREMAIKYHPDRNKNGEEMFKKIANAYNEIMKTL